MKKDVLLPWYTIMKSLELLGKQVPENGTVWIELSGDLKQERDKLLGEFYDDEE